MSMNPGPGTILVIDDSPTNLEILHCTLGSSGYDILVEMDGFSGIEQAKNHSPDLILLDVQMPGIDGFGVVEAIKSDPTLDQIPIIVITAKELSAIERERLNGKIKALLQKGAFMDSDLLSDIKQALP